MNLTRWRRWWRDDDDREDVCSDNQGTITFNYLQQRPKDCTTDDLCPGVQTTDPTGIVEA